MTRPLKLLDLVQLRAAALERYAEWESSHPVRLLPHAALEALGALYEMLPPSGRVRPIDPGGVARLHQLLKQLSE